VATTRVPPVVRYVNIDARRRRFITVGDACTAGPDDMAAGVGSYGTRRLVITSSPFITRSVPDQTRLRVFVVRLATVRCPPPSSEIAIAARRRFRFNLYGS